MGVGEVRRFSLWQRHGNCELTSEIPIQVQWFQHAAKTTTKNKNLHLLKIKSRGKILQIKSIFIVHHYTKHQKWREKKNLWHMGSGSYICNENATVYYALLQTDQPAKFRMCSLWVGDKQPPSFPRWWSVSSLTPYLPWRFPPLGSADF